MFNKKRILSLVFVIALVVSTIFVNSNDAFAKNTKVKPMLPMKPVSPM